MKKKYSKPTIKRIELKPEEAVLAGCKQRRVCPRRSRRAGS